MTKISDAARLAALVQLQMANRLNSSGGTWVTRQRSEHPSAIEGDDDPSVPVEVRLAVAELTGSGDTLHRAAFRIFLRHCLGKELGVPMPSSSSLDTLLDEVLARMETDANLWNSALTAGQRLVEQSQRRPK